MVVEIKMPRIGDGDEEYEMREWFVKPGDPIDADSSLCAVEVNKATMEINSENSGILKEILVPEGENLMPQTVICRIESD